MLNVDISNIWCSCSLADLLSREQSVAAAHAALMDGNNADFLSWLDGDNAGEVKRLREAGRLIEDESDVLVVVGSDSAALGAKALLELLHGRDCNMRGDIQVVFTGSDLSTAAWQRLSGLLETRDFCVHAVGREGMDLPSAMALRSLRWTLERRYGSEKARERLYITTDPSKGALRKLSVQEGCTTFDLPRTLSGHASVLSPAALLCLSAARIDLNEILQGAADARRQLEIRSFENPAWLYAGARTILGAKGRRVEYLCTAEPDARSLGRWWADLFGARGALLPAYAELPADLMQLHALLADGSLPLMQTVLRFEPPVQRVQVETDPGDLDGLNDLEGYTLDFLQEQTAAGAVQAAIDGDVPLVTVDCGAPEERTAGELAYFFELSSLLCAGMAGRDPYAGAPLPRFTQLADQLLGRSEMEA